ncbi:MAG: family 10 glycosylhydrolase [Verrucomicrobia bacterium]|nr:family 10 glycosylhydrolase [Verrucomicrobiota bacterium]
MKKTSLILSLVFALLISLLTTASAPAHLPEVRAIWVTRFDYKKPADVEAIVANCARSGFTDIFFQIRGNGTVFYPSRVEPWAHELTSDNASTTGRNPGWDPLQIAADSAKKHGIRLHAYMNVLPGWRGIQDAPRSAGQNWTAHPEWFMVDSLGQRMRPTSGWYSFLNPALPEVRQHLTAIAAELAKYDIAGVHLDYIRFPYDYKDVAPQLYPRASSADLARRSDFSYDRFSMEQVRKNYGGNWGAFRRDSVSQVVADLRKTVKAARGPQCTISSSVLADFDRGYTAGFQDSRRWAKEQMVDWLVPMNYNPQLFDERLGKIRKSLGRGATASQLVVGIDCKASPAEIRREIEAVRNAGCHGYALFAYSYLFEEHRPTAKAKALLGSR